MFKLAAEKYAFDAEIVTGVGVGACCDAHTLRVTGDELGTSTMAVPVTVLLGFNTLCHPYAADPVGAATYVCCEYTEDPVHVSVYVTRYKLPDASVSVPTDVAVTPDPVTLDVGEYTLVTDAAVLVMVCADPPGDQAA